jgi:hypothetical protein
LTNKAFSGGNPDSRDFTQKKRRQREKERFYAILGFLPQQG